MAILTFWFVVFPDITKPVGGIKQIHRIAQNINLLGHSAILVQDSADFHPSWFTSSVPTISKSAWLDNQDLSFDENLVVLPETYVPGWQDFFPKLRKIILNQNGAYSFGLDVNSYWKPSSIIDVYKNSLVSQIWCVSNHDYMLLSSGLGIPENKIFLLRNGIDIDVSLPFSTSKKYQIAFMPRKNKRDASIVCSLLSRLTCLDSWKFVCIQNMNHHDVITVLQESLIFLSFGHPEGFGLPVAEAMACGCSVVGYTGLGGRELYDIASKYSLGIPVEFGDWLGFVRGVEELASKIAQKPDIYSKSAQLLSMNIRQQYSMASMKDSLSEALSAFVDL